MGKRKKVQCEVFCGSIFNNQFQKKYRMVYYEGRELKIKIPGASANQFIVSIYNVQLN